MDKEVKNPSSQTGTPTGGGSGGGDVHQVLLELQRILQTLMTSAQELNTSAQTLNQMVERLEKLLPTLPSTWISSARKELPDLIGKLAREADQKLPEASGELWNAVDALGLRLPIDSRPVAPAWTGGTRFDDDVFIGLLAEVPRQQRATRALLRDKARPEAIADFAGLTSAWDGAYASALAIANQSGDRLRSFEVRMHRLRLRSRIPQYAPAREASGGTRP